MGPDRNAPTAFAPMRRATVSPRTIRTAAHRDAGRPITRAQSGTDHRRWARPRAIADVREAASTSTGARSA